MNKRLCLCMFILLGISCSGKLDRSEFIEWIRDPKNGLHVQKQSGDYWLDVQYQPASYMVLQRNAAIGKEEFAKEIEKNENLQYYLLKIGVLHQNIDFLSYQVQSLAEKQQKLYYYSYSFQNDIQLEDAGELLPCVLYHFERSSAVKGSRTFVLAFENKHRESVEAKLIINSSSLSSLPIKIKISKDTPALNI
jgi:hypothetical protein